MMKSDNVVVSIGFPVYNGEKFLKTRIDSILNQTFKNFELIISDNASTDQTRKICEEYAKQDSRILYIRQKKNMGSGFNFRFVLDNAKEKYFVWAAVDDLWEPTFLSKNIEILESNLNIVGSISKVDFFGKYADRYNPKPGDKIEHRHVLPFSGNYHDKVRIALLVGDTMIYSIFRTDLLKKSIPSKNNFQDGMIFMLTILKYGDFSVHDETLMHRGSEGISSVGRVHMLRAAGASRLDICLMCVPLINWSLENLGLKFIISNFDIYLRIFCVGYGRIVLDVIRKLK